MKPHTLMTTTVPCHFGKDGTHRITIGNDRDGRLVVLSSECDKLDPTVRKVADGLLSMEDSTSGKRADCCRWYVEDFKKHIGSHRLTGRNGEARQLDWSPNGAWEHVPGLFYKYAKDISSVVEDARDSADARRLQQARFVRMPEFVYALERVFHGATMLRAIEVRIDMKRDDRGILRPVYPYRNLRLEVGGMEVAAYRGRGIWSLHEESDGLDRRTDYSLHVMAFQPEIDGYRKADGKKWTCSVCGAKTARVEQHCKGTRHRRKFWDAVENGLEAINARLFRREQENRT